MTSSSNVPRRSTRAATGSQPVRRPTGAQPTRRSTRPTTGAASTSRSGPQSARSGAAKTGATKTSAKGGGKGGGPRKPRGKGKDQPRWKRILKQIGIWSLVAGIAVATIGFVVLVIKYQRLEVPEPNDFANAQASTIYYADGTTEMGRLGVANREVVDYDTLPEHVGDAIVAAEDRSFWTNPGVDLVGTARALYRTVVQGDRQGGSTITQQYVERYYVGETTTDIPGKIDEALMALKIDSQQEKEEILGNYMNTIYFGRGAYGIEAAAQEYFGKHAAELTVSESALLAGIVPAPSAWDPRLDEDQARNRWNYVLEGMVDADFISSDERAFMIFPTTIEYKNEDVFGGTQGYILRAAIDEVAAAADISQDEIETLGYRIVTTIQPTHQAATEAAVAQMPEGSDPHLRVAAVTVDSATGAITSMYGGADYIEIQRNAVTQDIAQAGSTFKPFALVAGLENGIGLGTEYVANSPMSFPGFDQPVRNFGNQSFGTIDLVRATTNSVNTAFIQLAQEVSPEAVRTTAIRAGIPEDTLGLDSNRNNVLGNASPHAIDMASAYSTFSNGGVSTEPFLVSTVTDSQGEVVYEHEVIERQEFAADVMADTTYAMQQVVRFGSGSFANSIGRPLAGKTGTSNENRSAWFVGFSPQITGAVALYQVGDDGSAEEITPFGGFRQITGSTVPTRIWTWMMGPILDEYEVVNFPPRANVGIDRTIEPSPEPTPEPTPDATVEPTPAPSPTPGPSIVPTPVPSVSPPAP